MTTTGTGRLAGEVALVTASVTGIGRAVARRFAVEGARVAVTGRNEVRGRAVVEEITEAGGTAAFCAADLGQGAGACRELVEAVVEEFGGLTVLVNNAADDHHDAPIHDLDPVEWDRILRVNLSAAAVLSREAIGPMLDADHGTIINISSGAARHGTPGHAAYTASKGGLDALTRAIAVDYARDRIRCNAISAGYVLDELRDRDLPTERRAALEAAHLTRLGEPEDIARAAVFLASADAAFITGVVLPVDGGSALVRARP